MGRRSQLKAHRAPKKTVRVFGQGMAQVIRFVLTHLTKVQDRLNRYDLALMSRALTIQDELGGRRPLQMYPLHESFENECRDRCSNRRGFVSVWNCPGCADSLFSCLPYNTFHLNDESLLMMRRNPHKWKWLLKFEKMPEEESRAIRMADCTAYRQERIESQLPHLSEDSIDDDSESANFSDEDFSSSEDDEESYWPEDEEVRGRTPVRGRMVDPDRSTSPQCVSSFPITPQKSADVSEAHFERLYLQQPPGDMSPILDVLEQQPILPLDATTSSPNGVMDFPFSPPHPPSIYSANSIPSRRLDMSTPPSQPK
jgi:hypothetical protein